MPQGALQRKSSLCTLQCFRHRCLLLVVIVHLYFSYVTISKETYNIVRPSLVIGI